LLDERAAAPSGPWTVLSDFRLTPHTSDAVAVLRDEVGELHEVSARAIAAGRAANTSSATRDGVAVNIRGHRITFEVPDRSDAWAPTATGDTGDVDSVAAPFPAVVVDVPVVTGDVVATGDVVVVVEAMKMLHSLAAHGAGTVAEVRCGPGDAVEANQVLVSFEQHEHDLPADPA